MSNRTRQLLVVGVCLVILLRMTCYFTTSGKRKNERSVLRSSAKDYRSASPFGVTRIVGLHPTMHYSSLPRDYQ